MILGTVNPFRSLIEPFKEPCEEPSKDPFKKPCLLFPMILQVPCAEATLLLDGAQTTAIGGDLAIQG